jgi:hypothetical protein
MSRALPLAALFLLIATGTFFATRALDAGHATLAQALHDFERDTGVRMTPADCTPSDDGGRRTCANDGGILLYDPHDDGTHINGAYFTNTVGAPAQQP